MKPPSVLSSVDSKLDVYRIPYKTKDRQKCALLDFMVDLNQKLGGFVMIIENMLAENRKLSYLCIVKRLIDCLG